MLTRKHTTGPSRDLKNTNKKDVHKNPLWDRLKSQARGQKSRSQKACGKILQSSYGINRPCDVFGNGELIKAVLKKSSSSRRPKRGDLVTITMKAKLASGTVVQYYEKLEMHVGDYEVVQGVDIAVSLMNVGEMAQVVMDASLAYRQLGLKHEHEPAKDIPRNATMIYQLHLLDAKHERIADLANLNILCKYGKRKKERANFWFNRSEYNFAIHLYKRALEYLDASPRYQLSLSDAQTLLEEALVVYNNLAMAQIKVSHYEEALQSVNNVLRHQPLNSKALYRKGLILEAQKDAVGALSLFKKAAELESENRAIKQHIAQSVLDTKQEGVQHDKEENEGIGKAKMMGLLLCTLLIVLSLHRYSSFHN